MEEHMNQNLLYTFVLFSGIVFVAQIVSIPFRKKSISKKGGSLLMPLENGSIVRVITIFVICALIIVLVPLRNFALWISAVLIFCALLGENFAVKDLCALGKAGIYENMIVTGPNVVYFDDIFSFPTLAYENDPETSMVDKQYLQVMRKNNSTVTLIFESEEKREAALRKILELRPSLNAESKK